MKLNRKKRNLIYIRKKNHLRRGGSILSLISIPEEIIGEENFMECILKKEIYNYSKEFKLNLDVHNISLSYVGNDFINGLKTIKLELKRVMNNQ